MARIRDVLARWLRALAEWLSPTPPPVVPDVVRLEVARDACYDRAVILVREMGSRQATGEYKRHQVYARLMKEYPDLPHRQIAVRIEAAVRELDSR